MIKVIQLKIFLTFLILSFISLNFVSIFNPFVYATTCPDNQLSCTSGSYGVGQVFFGSGGSLASTCSTNYCAKQSVGELGVGQSNSSSYQAYSGFNTNRYPYLQFIVNPANINFGVLSSSSTATGTATFSVENYLSNGYGVYSVGNPPTSDNGSGHQLFSYTSSPVVPTPGTEQFGINLVSNSTSCGVPVNFGANPVQVPSTNFSYGEAATGYNSSCKFMYQNGAEIADSVKSSGQTDFTISYIADISNVTPAGNYTMDQSLVAVPNY